MQNNLESWLENNADEWIEENNIDEGEKFRELIGCEDPDNFQRVKWSEKSHFHEEHFALWIDEGDRGYWVVIAFFPVYDSIEEFYCPTILLLSNDEKRLVWGSAGLYAAGKFQGEYQPAVFEIFDHTGLFLEDYWGSIDIETQTVKEMGFLLPEKEQPKTKARSELTRKFSQLDTSSFDTKKQSSRAKRRKRKSKRLANHE